MSRRESSRPSAPAALSLGLLSPSFQSHRCGVRVRVRVRVRDKDRVDDRCHNRADILISPEHTELRSCAHRKNWPMSKGRKSIRSPSGRS